MRIVDASSLVHAWDSYPIEIFPPLWKWLGEQVSNGNLQFPDVAYEEINNVSPDSGQWLKANGVKIIPINPEMLAFAMSVKKILGVDDDEYHPNGVGENDLLIISCASTNGAQLISDESRQNDLPKNLKRCKIPAVCDHDDVGVSCCNFLEYLKAAGVSFGR